MPYAAPAAQAGRPSSSSSSSSSAWSSSSPSAGGAKRRRRFEPFVGGAFLITPKEGKGGAKDSFQLTCKDPLHSLMGEKLCTWTLPYPPEGQDQVVRQLVWWALQADHKTSRHEHMFSTPLPPLDSIPPLDSLQRQVARYSPGELNAACPRSPPPSGGASSSIR